MKRLLPLVAVAGLLAACGGAHEECHHRDANGYCHNNEHGGHGSTADALSDRSMGNSRGAHNEKRDHYHTKDNMYRPAPQTYVVAPAVAPVQAEIPNYRPDGTYYLAPVYEQRGYQHKATDDALSDRPLGSSRGAHNERMDAKDSNNDGVYDYVPYYTPRHY